MRSREFHLMVELMAAMRGILAKDGHDRDCPKRRKSKDHACSHRCSAARHALAECQKFLIDTSPPTGSPGYMMRLAKAKQ